MNAGRSDRWDGLRARGDRLRRWLRFDVIAITVLILAMLVAAGIWVNVMISPVTRDGHPSVQPTPTTSPSLWSAAPTPTPSAPATPSASATPSPSPSTTPKMKSSGKFASATLNINSAASVGTLRTFQVVVETSTGLKPNTVGTQIAAVLNDPRSWAGGGKERFALVADPAQASFTIALASPATAGKSCVLSGPTCLAGTVIMIDARSWTYPPATYGDAAAWQAYATNHGVGLLLGKKPATCAGTGKPAPVMAPQDADLGGCVANPWPRP